MATALIRPLAWEPPYAAGVALEKAKRLQKKLKKKKKSCGVGRRHGSDPKVLWLWCRSVATAPIRPLAWELLYATGAALKSKNKYKNFLK